MRPDVASTLTRGHDAIVAANNAVIQRMVESRPVLIDCRPARDVVPDMTDRTIQYAGPPVPWEQQSGPQKGAIIGAMLLEGIAGTPEEAEGLVARGAVELVPNHHRNTVGSMAGVISASMPVWVVKNQSHGNFAYSTFESNLSFGSYAERTVNEIRWQIEVLQPVLGPAIAQAGGVDLNPIISKALQMGDDCHQRFEASTYMINTEFAKVLWECDVEKATLKEVFSYLDRDRLLFLGIAMAAGKATADAAHNIKNSTICTAVARNGTRSGIRVSGLGDRWFTGPAPLIVQEGVYFTGYSHEDASFDIGDSAITETIGLGGAAVYAAPTHWTFFGASPEPKALQAQRKMWDVCFAKHPHFLIPALDYQGTALGLDIARVIESGYEPIISTAIAATDPRVGRMVGAGLARVPMAAFVQALDAFAGSLDA